ncbi:MAG: hypothetical protein K0Q59_5466, partial [Paenibacillus sp.]|nr:hypothetical protein [Paenibacillus sp.]
VGRNIGWKKVGVSLPFVNFTDICTDSEEAFQFAIQLVVQLRESRGLGYIELRFKDQHLEDNGWSMNGQNYTFELPLTGDENDVLALSSSSNRNHVRKTYKNDWFSVSFDPSHLPAFYRVYTRRMKQLGSPSPDIAFFRHFFDYLPGQAHLLTMLDKQSGVVVGGMLLLASPADSTLYYPYGANLIEYNNKYPNNFMWWEAVKLGQRLGLRQLDLGRSPAGSSHYSFKEKWGAVPKQLKYYVYDSGKNAGGPPDRQSLSFFVKLWEKSPQWVTDAAGKRLIKYIWP